MAKIINVTLDFCPFTAQFNQSSLHGIKIHFEKNFPTLHRACFFSLVTSFAWMSKEEFVPFLHFFFRFCVRIFFFSLVPMSLPLFCRLW